LISQSLLGIFIDQLLKALRGLIEFVVFELRDRFVFELNGGGNVGVRRVDGLGLIVGEKKEDAHPDHHDRDEQEQRDLVF